MRADLRLLGHFHTHTTEVQTPGLLFSELVRRIGEQCAAPLMSGELSLAAERRRADDLILADTCCRPLFLLDVLTRHSDKDS